jgi:glycine cleavage system pyridoxal-binding protein P
MVFNAGDAMTIIYEVERKGESAVYIIREPDPDAAELLKRAVEKLGFKIKAVISD